MDEEAERGGGRRRRRKTGTLSMPSFSPSPSSEDRDIAEVLALPDLKHSPLSAPGIVLKIFFHATHDDMLQMGWN